MLDPILGKELCESDACIAHLLPQAVCPKSATVKSNRSFDNKFGQYNDSHLTRFIQNQLRGETDVEVIITDPNDHNKRVTSIHTKSKIDRCPSTGRHKGTFEIQYPDKTSDAWREKHMRKGNFVKIEIKPPDTCRIELSMLHSGHLTAYYNLGDDYILHKSSQYVRHILGHSNSDKLDDDIATLCYSLYNARSGLKAGINQPVLVEALKNTIGPEKHPVLIAILGNDSCLVPILPYHPKFTSIALLPGLENDSVPQWMRIVNSLAANSARPIAFAPFSFNRKSHSDAMTQYIETTKIIRDSMNQGGNC